MVKASSQYRKDMLEWRKARERREEKREEKQKEDEIKNRRVMLLVNIDKMSYADAYDKVFGSGY